VSIVAGINAKSAFGSYSIRCWQLAPTFLGGIILFVVEKVMQPAFPIQVYLGEKLW